MVLGTVGSSALSPSCHCPIDNRKDAGHQPHWPRSGERLHFELLLEYLETSVRWHMCTQVALHLGADM